MRHRNLDNLFDAFFGGMQPIHLRNEIDFSDENSYTVDYTKDGAYAFFEVPGFNKNNLKVELEDGRIYVEGKRSYKIEGQEKIKTISQKFKIGEGYSPESLEATIEDGILTIFIPNMKKSEGKKRISLI